MPDPTDYVPESLTNTGYDLDNFTTATWVAIVSGTGLRMPHQDVGVMLVKNTTGGNLTFKITVVTPARSGLDEIGKSITTQDYTIPFNGTNDLKVAIANAFAYRGQDANSYLTVDASATGLEFRAYQPITPLVIQT